MTKKNILVVDDEKDLLQGLAKILSHAGYHVATAASAAEGLEKVRRIRPHLMILDRMLPDWDGTVLKARANQEPELAEIPVIFLSAKGRPEDILEGFDLQADDYITKPFEPSELLARVARVIERKAYYEKIAMTDGLTGVPNVHLFKKEFRDIFNSAKRYKRHFTLAVADLDQLKSINDTHGHSAGDAVIKKVADHLQSSLRSCDLVFRYGGDEFVVLFPESNQQEAGAALGRLRKKLQTSEQITLSCGIVEYSEDFKTPEEMFKKADQEMYSEKKMKASFRVPSSS